MNTQLRFLVVVLALAILKIQTPCGYAQGTAFTYQGRLNDGAAVANGNYDLRFSLYNAASGGAQQGVALTNAATAVSNGLFTVMLDFGNQFPGADRWLEIGVTTNGGSAFSTLTPRQPLNATPYAVQAANANSATTAVSATTATTANSVAAANISGSLALAQLPTSLLTNNQTGVTLGGIFSGSHAGAGDGLTNLNAANLATGTVADARLSTNVALLNTNAIFAGNVTALGNVRGARLNIGTNNNVTGINASIAGGQGGSALADGGFIGAGSFNSIQSNSFDSVIGGGSANNIETNSQFSTIAGGYFGSIGAKSFGSTIGGGDHDRIGTNSSSSTIAGGSVNQVQPNASGSTIGGGSQNTTMGINATIPGGLLNAATNFAFASGRRAKANHTGAFVWADSTSADFASTTNDQFNVRANGGARFVTSGAGLTVDDVPVFTGLNGAVLTNLNAAQLTGTMPLALLPGAVVTNGASGVNISGTFSGNGSSMTNVSLHNLYDEGAISYAIKRGVYALETTVSGSNQIAVAVADLNGDGFPDLVGGGGSGYTVATNNRAGGFATAFVLKHGSIFGPSGKSVATVDLNGDGKMDLTGFGTALTAVTNNGAGGFVLASSNAVASARCFAVGDMNGDGRVDALVGVSINGVTSVYLNNGAGGFNSVSSTFVQSTGQPDAIVTADINGDGSLDIIAVSKPASASVVSVFTNNGTGSFSPKTDYTVGTGAEDMTAADINGDGWTDIVTANTGENTVSVLTNNQSGIFALAGTWSVGSSPYGIIARDLTGDGRPELITANFGSASVSILLNNGTGGFTLASSPSLGSTSFQIDAGDLNGDGQLELITANFSTGSFSVLYNTPDITGTFTGNGSGLTSLNATNLTGTINSNNIAAGTIGSAQIVDGAIVNADVNAAAAIAYSKLNLAGSIVNADVSPSAAIADTKLATISAAGKVSDSALSANVALLGANPQTFSGINNFATTVKVGTRALADGQLVNFRVVGNDGPFWKGSGAFGHSNATVIIGELSGAATIGGHNANLGAWANLLLNPVAGYNVGIGTTNPVTTLHVGGNATTAGFNIVSATTNTPTAAATLTATSGYVVLNPASAVTLNATTAIAAGTTPGQMLVLRGNSDVNTVTINDNAGTALGANRVIGLNDILSLVWTGSVWTEISYANN